MSQTAITAKSTKRTDIALRNEIHDLAETAFHQHLISGHGDGEYPDKYQIVYDGKPKHLSLDEARDFLRDLTTVIH